MNIVCTSCAEDTGKYVSPNTLQSVVSSFLLPPKTFFVLLFEEHAQQRQHQCTSMPLCTWRCHPCTHHTSHLQVQLGDDAALLPTISRYIKRALPAPFRQRRLAGAHDVVGLRADPPPHSRRVLPRFLEQRLGQSPRVGSRAFALEEESDIIAKLIFKVFTALLLVRLLFVCRSLLLLCICEVNNFTSSCLYCGPILLVRVVSRHHSVGFMSLLALTLALVRISYCLGRALGCALWALPCQMLGFDSLLISSVLN